MSEKSEPQGQFEVSNSVKYYTLFILMIVYAFNFIDRQILVILQPLIQVDLDLSDTQLGLMTGIAFALFYTIVGIPIARLADYKNRRNIIAISLTVWSGMTALSGFAQNFIQILLARLGVGIGEAGGSPPAHSMISDMFDVDKRATALAVYSAGLYLGILAGFAFGGYLGETYGWRKTFFVVGLPGIALAVLLWLTVPEPIRGRYEASDHKNRPSFLDVLNTVTKKKAFILLALGSALSAFGGYGTSNFMPSFLSRYHDMSLSDIGYVLALTIGISGMIGTFGSGYLADKLGKKDISWYMRIPAIGALINIPLTVLSFNIADTKMALTVYFLAAVTNSTYLAPCIAMAHRLVSPAMRATTSALLFFVLNLIGLGFGPLFVGGMSDLFASMTGGESLHLALTSTAALGFITTALYWVCSKRLEKDINSES